MTLTRRPLFVQPGCGGPLSAHAQGMGAGPAKRVLIVKALRNLPPPLIVFLSVMFIISAVVGYVLGPSRRQAATVPPPSVAAPPEIVEPAPSTPTPDQSAPSSGVLAAPQASGSSPPPGGESSATPAPPSTAAPPPSQASPPGPSSSPPGQAGGGATQVVPPVPPGGPARPQPPKAGHVFRVQAGAFNVRQNAQALLDRLRSHGYTADIVESDSTPRYRVWVGGELDRSAAERLVAGLRADGFDAALIAR